MHDELGIEALTQVLRVCEEKAATDGRPSEESLAALRERYDAVMNKWLRVETDPIHSGHRGTIEELLRQAAAVLSAHGKL